jgi:hypothetical protein
VDCRQEQDLAGHELTNREIAQALVVTSRTVEAHLTTVSCEPRIESRDEFRAAARR